MNIQVIKTIGTNVLTALYEPFGFAVVMAFLFMFFFLVVKQLGIKSAFLLWIDSFKGDIHFRKVFVLAFYTAMILFETLLNRTIWSNPVENVIGIWGLYTESGEMTTEVIENIVLFVPFTMLLLWCFGNKIVGSKMKLHTVIYKTAIVTIEISCAIEFLQLFLRLGTIQASDVFYNSLGGVFGGILYWIIYYLRKKNQKAKGDSLHANSMGV